jgi:hypothetical protein
LNRAGVQDRERTGFTRIDAGDDHGRVFQS